MLDVINVVGTLIVGAIGWGATRLVGEPFVILLRLRRQIQEDLVFYSHIGWVHANGTLTDFEKKQCDEARPKFRRFAAQVDALSATWPSCLKSCLQCMHIDLQKAKGGLFGLQNSLGDHEWDIEFYDKIQKALALPPCRSEEERRLIRKVRQVRNQP